MISTQNKRDISWGVLLITLGLVAMANLFANIPEWIDVILLAAGGVIILVLFLLNRNDWSLLIPAYILLAAALIMLIIFLNLQQGTVIAPAFLLLTALPFFAIFLFNPKQKRWALIPTWILVSLALMIFLLEINLLSDGLIPLYVLSSIGLPFLVVYLLNRNNWWALIPAWVLFSIGFMVFLIDIQFLADLAVPAYVLFAVALPFFVAFLSNRKSNRWALIPGGIIAAIGLGFFASTSLAKYVFPAVLIIVGSWVLINSLTRREA